MGSINIDQLVSEGQDDSMIISTVEMGWASLSKSNR